MFLAQYIGNTGHNLGAKSQRPLEPLFWVPRFIWHKNSRVLTVYTRSPSEAGLHGQGSGYASNTDSSKQQRAFGRAVMAPGSSARSTEQMYSSTGEPSSSWLSKLATKINYKLKLPITGYGSPPTNNKLEIRGPRKTQLFLPPKPIFFPTVFIFLLFYGSEKRFWIGWKWGNSYHSRGPGHPLHRAISPKRPQQPSF